MLRIITIFTLLVLVGSSGHSQSIDSEYKNSIKKILSSKFVSDVVEDLDGYIWIATDEGVYRYNGTKSIRFTTNEGLPTNDIIYLNVDSKNRLWLTGFYSGVYYIENNKVKKIANSENAIDVAYGFEKNDTIYFHDKEVKNSFYCINEKLYKYENKLFPKNKILDYYLKNNLTIEYDNYRIFINDKNIPFETNNKEDYFYYPNLKYGTPTFIKFLSSSNFPFIKREFENSFLAYENGKLITYKIDSLLPATDIIHNFGKFENKDHSVFLTSKNKIIVNTKGIYNPNLSTKLNNLKFDFSGFYFVYIDSKNNFWFIDKNKLLYFVANNYDDTKTVFTKEYFKKSQEYIIDFIKYKNMYIIASSENKIYLFDRKRKQIKTIKDYKNVIVRSLNTKGDTLFVNQQNYMHIFKLNENSVKEIYKYDKSFKRVAFYKNEVFFITPAVIYNSKTIKIWEEKNTKGITSIALDATHFYLTTYDNLIRLNKKTKAILKTPIKNGSKVITVDNYLVVGTNEGQVLLFNKNLQLIDKIIKDEKIIGITYDTYSKWIYIQTKSTITFYSKNKHNKLQFEYQINNISNNERLVSLRYDKDFIYYSSENTINKIKKQQLIKPLEATLDINNGVLIGTQKKIENNAYLQRKENSLTFDVSLKTYNNINDFIVYYTLIHNNDIVIENEKIRLDNLTLHNLNPGNYEVQFKVVPKYGNSKPTFSTFSFNIDYYFWERFSFKIILGLLFISLIGLIMSYIRDKKMKKIKAKVKLNELELKALKAQMNPHFIFNTLNNIQSSIMLDDEIKVSNYFGKFAKLLRSTLDIVNRDLLTIADEIEYINSYVSIENLRLNPQINLIYDIDEEIKLSEKLIPVMFLQPIVENAIVHGLSGIQTERVLKISIKKNGESLLIEIENNGVGRNIENKSDKAKNHTSYATKIVSNRMKLYQELTKKEYTYEIIDLVDENLKAIGTKVVLNVPIIDDKAVTDI